MSSLSTLVSISGLLDAALKSTAVVLVALAAAGLLRRASAAWRHLVWCLSVASLLLLPALSLALPDWRVAWLPRWTGTQTEVAATEPANLAPADRAEPLDLAAIVPPASAALSDLEPHSEPHRPPPARVATIGSPRAAVPWLAIAWLAGGLLSLVPLLIGLWQLAALHRHSRIISDHRWLGLLDELRRQLAVWRGVRLRRCHSALAPLTWGALRPVLLVPFEADAWPDERRRLVLLHELAHIRRWDWLTQLVAHAACAVYWFNPLVWFAARQMRIERERACDDIVLASGARPSDYARELLAVAAGLSNSKATMLAALPMARRGQLNDRLQRILDRRHSRGALARSAACLVAALAAAAMAPLAMLRAAPPESTEAETRKEPRQGDRAPAPYAPAEHRPKKELATDPIATLEMTVNTRSILDVGKPLPRIQVDNPEVAEITALSETHIQVMAKKPGMTQVKLFDADGNVYTVDTIVYPDGREVKLLLRKENPMDAGPVGQHVAKAENDQAPLALAHPEVKEIWDVTMAEAIRTGLTNSRVVRNLGGVLLTPVAPQASSVEDPKISRGTAIRLVLTRADNHVALVDFKAGVRNTVYDLERAYWELYYQYRNLNAVQAALDSALQTWRKVHGLYEAGGKGGEAEKEAQAREQYFLFRAQVENSLALLYTAESRLRYMMGLPPTDGRLIRPADEPTTGEIRFDWKEVRSKALDRGLDPPRDEELVLALKNSLRDLDRNYQVSRTTFNRRVAAAKQLEAVKATYELGTATLDMLLDAQRRLADAETAYYRALVDYNVAILQVHFRKGSVLEYDGILLTEGTSQEPIDPFRHRVRVGD